MNFEESETESDDVQFIKEGRITDDRVALTQNREKPTMEKTSVDLNVSNETSEEDKLEDKSKTSSTSGNKKSKLHSNNMQHQKPLSLSRSENKPPSIGTCLEIFKEGPGKCFKGDKCQYEHNIDLKKSQKRDMCPGIC